MSATTDATIDLLTAMLAELRGMRSDLARIATTAPAPNAAPRASGAASGAAITNLPSYGRGSGKPIGDADEGTLDYYAGRCREAINDPGKSKFHAKERAMLAAIEAEIVSRHGGGQASASSSGAPPDFGDPGVGEEDLPFVHCGGIR